MCVRARSSVRIDSMKKVGGERMRYRRIEKEAHPEPPEPSVPPLATCDVARSFERSERFDFDKRTWENTTD